MRTKLLLPFHIRVNTSVMAKKDYSTPFGSPEPKPHYQMSFVSYSVHLFGVGMTFYLDSVNAF